MNNSGWEEQNKRIWESIYGPGGWAERNKPNYEAWKKWRHRFHLRFWRLYLAELITFISLSLNKPLRQAVQRIPKGDFCYDYELKQFCPYWAEDALHPRSKFPKEFGYCTLLHKSDFDLNEEPVKKLTHYDYLSNGERKITVYKNKSPHEMKIDVWGVGMLWDWIKACHYNGN